VDGKLADLPSYSPLGPEGREQRSAIRTGKAFVADH
jgi:hypothetical protein